MKLVIDVSVRRVIQLLILVAFVLTALSISGQLYRSYVRLIDPNLFGFVPLLDVGQDQSIPAWYSAFLLLFCSVLLALISLVVKNAGGRYVNHWRVLSLIFLYLSVDEGASIHEKAGRVTRAVYNSLGSEPGGVMPIAWVVPGIVFVFIFVLAYLKFFFHLPTRQRYLFLAAGVIYVGAAMGMEVFYAYYRSLVGPMPEMTNLQQIGRILIISSEELLEMFGLIVFIYALLSYIRSRVRDIGFQTWQ
jgi:hypothetical protein